MTTIIDELAALRLIAATVAVAERDAKRRNDADAKAFLADIRGKYQSSPVEVKNHVKQSKRPAQAGK